MKSHPIDKTKRSNRRCVNCQHYHKRTERTIRFYGDKLFHCPVADKDIDYWNCCKYFQWAAGKDYV